ncbi:hypothetical protein HLH44_01185 [Gluconacetobacter sp. 1c LMG 22058]|uniref:Nicotinate-nucleotide--dimethylbenzimidazole phosphoribosyltransferase n=1 Tax=Gluconacetobacter dulcium TaxID=2729096 RepID=A0A7W4PFC9_9PROT|nr:hypothetical protein [Gluconacetobacter dulcium]
MRRPAPPDDPARQTIATRAATSMKPGASLSRLKDLTAWPGACQGRTAPMLEHVRIVIFAGNHEAVRHGVSPWAARWSAISSPEAPRSTNSPKISRAVIQWSTCRPTCRA